MEFDIKDRVTMFKNIVRNLKKVKNGDNGVLIGQGVQGKVYKNIIKDDKVVLKVTTLDATQKKLKDSPFNTKALMQPPFIELTANLLVRELVLQRVCQNFTMMYDYNISECGKKSCTNQYMEYINYSTFEDWCNRGHNNTLWRNALFQILAGLYALRRHFNMTHNDFHDENVLVYKVESGGYWVYNINGVRYYVQNLGYIFCIADFGFSWIPGKMYPKDYVSEPGVCQNGKRRVATDIYKLRSNLKPILKKMKDINNFKSVFLKEFDKLTGVDNKRIYINKITDIIESLYGSKIYEPFKDCDDNPNYCYDKKKYVSGKCIDTFNLSRRLKKYKRLPKELYNFIVSP